ncbi:MAG TPA: nitroreductase [Anaerolineales bacterium]|nr:nitroreductase [Anaerolineales bacterium]HMR98823.1 nitroreductase [Anaerolineales bacterium]HNQ95963.1 nitroreductase [Anaerolineales bacterium]HNS61015.1 nitroreductase [Anaerolineales bacterium]
MDVIEAIHHRHSNAKVKQDAIPREAIETLLSAAVQAPNHYKVRPWRFIVLTGNGLDKLGEVFVASFADRQPDLPAEALDKTRALPHRAPLIIAVGVDQPAEPKVLEIENIVAVSAACQNLLLAAEAEGLAVKWRTGEWALDAKVKEFLGFAPDQHLIAFLYIGYPELVPEAQPRPSFEDRTVWME